MPTVNVQDFEIGPNNPLAVMSGPCVIESEDHSLQCAELLKNITSLLPINFIFKSSYDKANRSSIDSFRGPGLDEGLRILERVKKELEVPVVTDVHTPEEARAAGEVCDVIQIPAFLCRQTDLLLAAGESGAVVNIKKGQFMAPWDMAQVAEKVASTGNEKIILVERGASFGYNNLVSDMRSIPIMEKTGYPVCYDASHSVQLPGGGKTSGGNREYIPHLSRAAVAAGCHCLFIESHPDPANAKSDAASVFPLDQISDLLVKLHQIHQVVQQQV